MLPTINGKKVSEWSFSDLQDILDNEDFRESDYLDYKKSFEYFDIPKNNTSQRNEAKAELRKDICAFANAQGGYLIFGIKEDGKGVPHTISGIVLENGNKDTFESTIKNILQTINPRMPLIKFHYIDTSDSERFVVILEIVSDQYAPYVFVENNRDYRIYKRVGNANSLIPYMELKNMFIQSLSLDKEIHRFRSERLSFFNDMSSNEGDDFSHYLLLHIIPDTFLDSNYNVPLIALERKGSVFSSIFQSFSCNTQSNPIIEGLRYQRLELGASCRLYNSGLAECCITLSENNKSCTYYIDSVLARTQIWKDIKESIIEYTRIMKDILSTQRVYVCISVIGCQGIVTAKNSIAGVTASIDRNSLLCEPCVIDDIQSTTALHKSLLRLELDFYIALGIRTGADIEKLIKTVYGV